MNYDEMRLWSWAICYSESSCLVHTCVWVRDVSPPEAMVDTTVGGNVAAIIKDQRLPAASSDVSFCWDGGEKLRCYLFRCDFM